jgi:transposase
VEQIRTRVAGLDVHRDSVTACARTPDEAGNPTADRRKFKTTTAGLGELAVWLADHQVTTAGMDATGVYGRPVYYALEGLVNELWLCNAHHVKNVPGRKTDMADAEWLADVVAQGMVRPSPALWHRSRRLRLQFRRGRVTSTNRGSCWRHHQPWLAWSTRSWTMRRGR